MSAANVAHHVYPRPIINRGGSGTAKDKTLTKPHSINPTKNVELALDNVKEIKDPTVIVVKADNYQSTITVSRPLGTTEINQRDSYIVSVSTDLAYIQLENPRKPAADRRFEREAISTYVELELFNVIDDSVYYVGKSDKDEREFVHNVQEFTRDEYISHAKRVCDSAIKDAKKKHLKTETEAGRTGQMRPDGQGKAAKPRDFDASKFKWIDYLDGVKTLEEAFIDFKKSDDRLRTAREERKHYLSQCTTKIGSSNSVEQKEALALRGVSARLSPSTIMKIIIDALSRADPSAETISDHEETDPITTDDTATKNRGGTPKPSSVAGLMAELDFPRQDGGHEQYGSMDEYVDTIQGHLEKTEEIATGLLDPIYGKFSFTTSEMKEFDECRDCKNYPDTVRSYFQLRAGTMDRAKLKMKFDALSTADKKLARSAVNHENSIALMIRVKRD